MAAPASVSLPQDLVPNRQTLNRIAKSPKSNQISNRSDPNRILNGQIESREAIQSRFKSNRDWDLPITGNHPTNYNYDPEILWLECIFRGTTYFIACCYHPLIYPTIVPTSTSQVENIRFIYSVSGIRRKRLNPANKQNLQLGLINGLGCTNYAPELPGETLANHSIRTN